MYTKRRKRMSDFNSKGNEKEKSKKDFDSYEPSQSTTPQAPQSAPSQPTYSSLSQNDGISSYETGNSYTVDYDSVPHTPSYPRKKAINGLVFGILSIVLGCYPFACFVGFFFAISALGKAGKAKQDYRGLSKGARITGVIGLIMSIIMSFVSISSIFEQAL